MSSERKELAWYGERVRAGEFDDEVRVLIESFAACVPGLALSRDVATSILIEMISRNVFPHYDELLLEREERNEGSVD